MLLGKQKLKIWESPSSLKCHSERLKVRPRLFFMRNKGVEIMLTFEEIREIINLVNQSSIQHFEIEHDKTRIVISKVAANHGQGGAQQETDICSEKIDSQAEVSSAMKGEQVIKTVIKDDKEKNLHKIVSPTVGTFYSASEPGAEPFVTIGAQITSNTIVCVLEAMKLFNEVEAGVNGEVVEVLVKEGDFIEYGQPLFLIKTNS